MHPAPQWYSTASNTTVKTVSSIYFLIVNLSHPCLTPPSLLTLLQESISDFYWYYSGKDVIDEQGQRNFSKAINVAKQVFNTLTEYIQVREDIITAEVTVRL